MNRAKININRCERFPNKMIPREILFDNGLFEVHMSVFANGFVDLRRPIDGEDALHRKIFKGHVGFHRFELQSRPPPEEL